MPTLSFEAPIVPQRFISVVSAQSDLSPHLPVSPLSLSSLIHLPLRLSLSTSSSAQIGCSSDTEHKLKHTLPVCVMNGSVEERGERRRRRRRGREVEEEKVTVFPESKPPVFDHGESCC